MVQFVKFAHSRPEKERMNLERKTESNEPNSHKSDDSFHSIRSPFIMYLQNKRIRMMVILL